MTEILSNLKAARALISSPKNWCKRYMCKKGRRPVSIVEALAAGNPSDFRFCAVGALDYATGLNILLAAHALETLSNHTPSGIIRFNDNHTHKQVLALFDEAIAELEKETF